ncbi:hypothetical protein EXU85_28930 [Spirosoma sp. KCTC 42546]|uniref:asparagine synthase-related protein n=1 Tax=Spirosoma sp. KCTC 42546 TaxID=2520506 RepID=UPI0011590157|nr:asparagine synthase-related protein [Spirosoma sp. KCTC 42546]QDK82416.1 hypothetical protein EXU85_28930 [Spirosoma sp. KCTC 42546]
MSLLFGFLYTDNTSLVNELRDGQLLDNMYKGIEHFPHEKKASMFKDAAAFGHALTYNTPEALYEQMPLYIEDQQLLFVSEGRIDNRTELASALELSLNDQLSDGQLMLKSYQRWGENAPTKLLGDWSFACFHATTKELFIARDHHGYSTVFYHFDGKQFSFSTSIKSLLALENVAKKANESYIISDLVIARKNEQDNETIYKGIYILPPAYTLKLKKASLTINRYWFPEHIELIYRKNLNDYIDELREILTKSISARLRSYKSVASMLSGGLDSSTVSFLAAELLAKSNQPLATLSHVPLFKKELNQEESNSILDEGPFVEAIALASGNINSHRLTSKYISPIKGICKMVDINDSIIHGACNAYWLVDIYETTKRNGFSTLLTGDNGNATISYPGVHYLLPFNHPSFLKNPKKLIKSVISKQFVFRYLRSFVDEYIGHGMENYIRNVLYVQKPILTKWNILENNQNYNRKSNYSFYPNAKTGMLDSLMAGQNPRCMFGANTKHFYGIELRDPTADKRVVEFCLSIPNCIFFDEKGNNKQVIRKMMEHRLPDKVLFEKKKGLQSSDIVYRALAEQNNITNLLAIVCRNSTFQEIIHTKRLRDDWQSFQKQKTTNLLQLQTLLKTLMLGYFLETNDL